MDTRLTPESKIDYDLAIKGIAAAPKFNWRHQYDEPRDIYEGELATTYFTDPSLTVQSHAEDANLNTIVARYGITDGAFTPAPIDPTYYGDFSDAPEDFRQVLDQTKDALEKFNKLPAKIRKQFDYDPATLHRFIHDPENHEEAIKLGLLHRDAPKDTRPVAVQRKEELLAWAAKHGEEAAKLGFKTKTPRGSKGDTKGVT